MLALTYGLESAGEPTLLDPLTGRRYSLDEAQLPDGLREFLVGMLEASDRAGCAETPDAA